MQGPHEATHCDGVGFWARFAKWAGVGVGKCQRNHKAIGVAPFAPSADFRGGGILRKATELDGTRGPPVPNRCKGVAFPHNGKHKFSTPPLSRRIARPSGNLPPRKDLSLQLRPRQIVANGSRVAPPKVENLLIHVIFHTLRQSYG